MFRIRKYPPHRQVIIAFSVLAAFIVITLVLDFYGKTLLEKHNIFLIENIEKRLTIISDVNETVGSLQVSVFQHVLTSLPNRMESIERSFRYASNINSERLNRYKRFISTQRGRELYNQVIQARTDYIKLTRELLEISRENKEQEARMLIDSEQRLAYDAYKVRMQEMEEHLRSLADSSSTQTRHILSRIDIITDAASAVGLIIVISMGFVLTSVTRRLKQDNWNLGNEIRERKAGEIKLLKLNNLYATLSQVNQSIVHIRNRDALYKRICEVPIEFGNFRMAWIGIADPETGIVNPVAFAGHEDGYLSGVRITCNDEPEGRGPTGQAIRTASVVVSNDIRTDPKMSPWREEAGKRGYMSQASCPIKSEGKAIGVFNLYSEESDFFHEREISLVEEIGFDISFALETIEKERKQKEAEDALRYSEERYRNLFQAVPVGIMILDISGNIQAVNPSIEKLAGIKQESIKRIDVKSYFADISDMSTLSDLVQKTGKVEDYEFQCRFPDGSLHWLLINAEVILLGSDHSVLTTIRDVSERKENEEKLRQREREYRALAEHSPDIIIRLNRNMRYSYVNPAIKTQWKLDPKEYLGRHPREIGIPEDFIKKLEMAVEKVLGSGEIVELELEMKEPAGVRYYESKFAPEYSDDGYIYSILGMSRDITERKNVERSLIEAKEKADRASALKDWFIASMSHEIRTPLNIIMGYSNLIASEMQDKLSDMESKALECIDQAGRRLMRTIENILNISSMRAGTFEPIAQKLNVSAEIAKLVSELRQSATEKGLFMTYRPPDSPIYILADRYAFTQAVNNLLDNAIKFTLEGGVFVEISQEEEAVCVIIHDTGIGISDEYLPNLFLEFSQEVHGYTRPYDGLGLGLALVKQYVVLCNGVIEVETEKNAGTIFTLRFPGVMDEARNQI